MSLTGKPLVEYLSAQRSRREAHVHTRPQIPLPRTAVCAFNWNCVSCVATYAWDASEWDGDTDDPPVCFTYLEPDDLVTVNGPEPDDHLE